MTHFKKSLALLLAFVMIFSSMSVAASAFDPKVDDGFALDFVVKFFRMERNEDGLIIDEDGNVVADANDNIVPGTDLDDINWVETTKAKPGEKVKAKIYIGTDYYTNSGNIAILFDSRFLNNHTFEDGGVRTSLKTNNNYSGGSLRFGADSAGWFSDETRFSQNINGSLVTRGIISADYFDDYDLIATSVEFKSGKNSLLDINQWLLECDFTVYDNEHTRTPGNEGTARVPKELAASTTSGKPMFINMPKGAANTNNVTNGIMYFWDANVSDVPGVITTTGNVVLDANGGYYLNGGSYTTTQTVSGIIGDQVTELGGVTPSKADYIHVGWSKIPVPADRTFTPEIKEALHISDAQAAEQGNVLTEDQVEGLTLSPVDLASYKYSHEDKTLYAVWAPTEEVDNYYTYQAFFMLPDGTYSATPDHSQQILAEAGSVAELVKTPVEGYTLNLGMSDETIIVKGDKSSVLNAYYSRNKYTVNYHYTDRSEVPQVQEHSNVYYGAEVPAFDSEEFPNGVPTKEGYTFTGWKTEDGQTPPKTMPAGNVDLYPEFVINEYTYIFDATQGGQFESNDSRTVSFVYEFGATPEEFDEIPVYAGKTFIGWSEDLPETVTEDKTFVALYDDIEYTVKFVDGEATLDEYTAFYGDKVVAKDVPEGYKAENSWYVENADGTKTVVAFPYEVKGDVIFNAMDDANVYNADFYVDDKLYESVPTIYDEEIDVPADPVKEGYEFIMWDPEVGKMDEDGKIFNAVFKIKTTKITFVDTGDTVIDPIVGDYNTPVTTVIPNPVKEGHTFAGWNTPVPSTMPAEDMTIAALWTTNSYSIRFENHDGSLIEVVTAPYGSNVKAPALPVESGYEYAWDKEVPATMPAENMTIKAVRTPLKFSISFDTNEGVPAEIAPIENVNCGDPIEKPADPQKPGFTFGGWAKVNAPATPIDFPETMPAGGLDLIAIWNANTHKAVFDAAGGVYVDGSSTKIVDGLEYGADVAAPEVPTREGYIFDGWNPVPDKMLDEDMIFTAQWTPDTSGSVEYKINVVTINPADGSEITQTVITNTAADGETVEIVKNGESSEADHVYTFEALINSESNVLDEDRTTETSMTVEAGEENVLTVYCKLKDVKITFLANGGKFADNTGNKVITGKYGEEIVVPEIPTRTGYKFTGWHKPVEGATFTADDAYVAQWEAETYYAIFNINGEEYAKVPYEFGEKITAPEYTPAEDETFSGWSIPTNTVMGPGDMIFDATLTTNEYTLSYSYSTAPASAELPASVTGLNYNSKVDLADATAVAGYIFNGWKYDGNVYAEGAEFTMPNGNATVVGSYTAIVYDITYDTGDSAVTVPDSATKSAIVDTVITLPALTRDGYTFGGWEYNGATYSAGAQFTMPAEEVEFEAIWNEIPAEPGKFDVVYSWTGDIPADVTLPENLEDVEAGSTVTVADVPSSEGYTFAGWYYNGKITESFVMPEADAQITGVWTKDEVPPTKYELSLDAADGIFGDGTDTYTNSFEEGQTVVTPGEPTREGYKFAGWVDASGNAASIPATMPANNVSLTATWSELIDITYNVDGELYDTATDAGEAGDPLPVPSKGNPEKEGFIFAGWVDSEGNPVTEIPDEDITVEADWEEIIPETYTIKYYDGATLLKTEQYEEDEPIAEYTLSDKEGYTFNGWTGMPADGLMNAEDIEVFAEWLVNKNDITLDAGEGKFADDSSIFMEEDVPYGTPLAGIVPAQPTREGYEFLGWADEDGNIVTIPTTMPDEEINLTAKWEIKEIKVTFDAGEGAFADGTATKDVTGEYGSDIEIPADPTREGFEFKGWIGLPADGKMPAEDITVEADWEAVIETYTLTIDAAGGKVEGQDKIVKELAEGEAIADVADPIRDGYIFKGWDKEIPATMPAEDLTITATWEAEATPSHTVTYYLAKDGVVYDTRTFEEGETMVHPDPIAEGIVFKGWADENGNPLPEVMGTEDINAYAVIDYVKSYKATYVVEGVTYQEYDVTFGSAIPVPADPTREGYIFAGWRDANGKPVAATMPAKDVTYTALWEKAPIENDQFTAKFVVDGSTYALSVLEEGDKIPVPPAPTKFGFVFVGWEPEVPAAMPAEDMVFEAQWEIDKTFVTLVIGGAVVSGAIVGAAIGSNAALITGVSIVGGILVIIGVAGLIKHTHTVTYMVDGEVYRVFKVVEGTKIPVPADPAKDGSKFNGWTPEVPEKMGNSDLVFEATWGSESGSDIDVVIPDTGSAAGIAAFAAISGAAAAAYVLVNRKKKDEE